MHSILLETPAFLPLQDHLRLFPLLQGQAFPHKRRATPIKETVVTTTRACETLFISEKIGNSHGIIEGPADHFWKQA